MKVLGLLAILLLVGCSTPTPITIPFPEVPKAIDKECPKLSEFKQDSQLSDVVRNVTENNIRYHECARQVDAWRTWYSTQKKIYNDAIEATK
jgi:hypothetical protein